MNDSRTTSLRENIAEKRTVIKQIEEKMRRTEQMIEQAGEDGRDPRPLRSQLAGFRASKDYMEVELHKLVEKISEKTG